MIIWMIALFAVPALVSLILWTFKHRKSSWYGDDLSPSGILNGTASQGEAAIYVLCARTEGLKGGLALHAWIVTKEEGSHIYNRYDKVGWGSPIRKNDYAPDAKWYANEPQIIKVVKGPLAQSIIPKIERAIVEYPHAEQGNYMAWPGPNSNSFIAYILRQVPELETVLPGNAVGRDYLAGGRMIHWAPDGRDVSVNFYGLIGFAVGSRSGIELSFLGLVIGVEFINLSFKVPGFGKVEMPKLVKWTSVRPVVQNKTE